MNLSEIFIRRPIATSLVMLGITVFGIVAYRALPVSDLPERRLPDAQRQRGSSGRRPGHHGFRGGESLERQFTTIAGLDEMTSPARPAARTSRCSSISHRNIDSAAVDVQTAIAAVCRCCRRHAGAPVVPEVQSRPTADHVSGLTSDTLPMCELDDYAETMIAPRISMVSGVSQVQVQGAQKYAVRVQVDPEKLQAEKSA